MPEIVLVNSDPNVAARHASFLERAGYRVTLATTFKDARELLAAGRGDILVSDIRLAEFNGLHLAAYARMFRRIPVVVTHGKPDAFFRREAMKLGAAFVAYAGESDQDDSARLVDVVRQLCPATSGEASVQRQWPRTPVPPVPVTAAGHPAHIVDVSYNGVRLSFDQEVALPHRFDIESDDPMLNVTVLTVWQADGGHAACGASVTEQSRDNWCSFVDSIQA